MKTTERRHWVNGYRKLGLRFKTYSFSFSNFAVMLCWGIGMPYINLYRLDCDGKHKTLTELFECKDCEKFLREKC